MASDAKLPWRVQWHIAADGTVIEQRSKGEENHQQLFQHYPTTRRVSMPEVVALQERLARSHRAYNMVLWPLLILSMALLAAALVGLGLSLFHVEVGIWLMVVGFPGFLVIRLLMSGVTGRQISRSSDRWREEGFESHQGVTIAAREALEMIAAPGTASGPETRVKRA
ncbi:MAG: hypothetical protein L0H93_14220 [Nocardioides sp.]|nr:hypothetical protein [Nocardioides sp.]